MRKRMWLPIGVLIALAGLVFTLQGIGVLRGSSMTGATFWAIAGPIIAVAGLLIARVGSRAGMR